MNSLFDPLHIPDLLQVYDHAASTKDATSDRNDHVNKGPRVSNLQV